MKKYIIQAIVSCFFLYAVPTSAQKKELNKAATNYEQFEYVNAQKIYLAVAEKGFESEELFTKLGNSFYFNAQYDQAAKWYGKLLDLNPELDEPIIMLRYSQALKAMGEDKKAKQFYNNYVGSTNADLNVKSVMDYQAMIQENSDRYELGALELLYNESEIAFGRSVVDNKLIFAATEEKKSFRNNRSAWDGLSFLSLYEVPLDEQYVPTEKPRKMKGALESKFHESSPTYSEDGNTMYFTRSNVTSSTKKKDQKLKIYRTIKINGAWGEPEELNFNDDSYSSAHPALNAAGDRIYFSSDRPGGFGESDLYVASIAEDGTIGEPKNLGPEINTPGKETFPFVSKDNELYFSSDGHFGLGGLDVFYVKILKDGLGNLLNVGAPVNTYADDFAFGIDMETHRGFVSSNRSDKKGKFVYDNIYSFLETKPIVDVYFAEVKGTVKDKETGLPLEGATVILTNADGKIHTQVVTDNEGQYKAEINKYNTYFVKAKQERYDSDEHLTKPNLITQEINFELQENEVALTPGTDLAKVLNIPIIYFDFDKSDIRKDAQVELEKLLATLNQYPNLKMQIRSHTDSRGNDDYNKALSQRRATSTLNYLVDNGVDAARLSAVGLGETELVNKCSNGVPCTAEEHQKNRRSEFIVQQ